MRIQISGFSGAGKSTLSKKLASLYNTSLLHIDTINFNPNFIERDRKLLEDDLNNFINTNDSWVIDGNYFKCVPSRYEIADKIIILSFNRFTCLKRTLKRTSLKTQREDMAKGCVDKFSLSFIMWVLFLGRTRKYKKEYKNIINRYKDKVIVLRNQKDVDNYLMELENERKN